MQAYLLTTTLNPQRTDQALENLRLLGIENPNIIYGKEKDKLNDDLMLFVKPGYEVKLTPGEIAVAFGHAMILREIIRKDEGGLVFEDDFRLWTEDPNMTWELAKESLQNIPEGTDFCYFSKHHTWNPEPHVVEENDNERYKKIERPTFGIQCYYISPRLAMLFYEKLAPLDAAVDVLYHFQMPTHMTCRHHYPELFWHGDDSVKD